MPFLQDAYALPNHTTDMVTKPGGLYVHVPLCHAKCRYCGFYSLPRCGVEHALVNCLLNEWRHRSRPVRTVYVGGGTPSALGCAELSRLLDGLPRGEEVTVEVNPEDVSPALAEVLATRATRVSMGVQSLVDGELAAVGRRHTAAQAIAAVHTLRTAGINNLSLDLIYGLPGQTLDSWQHSLDGILALHPEHLSAYALEVEPGTRLYTQQQAGKITVPDADTVAAMYGVLCNAARNAAYSHYEIANFALPGRESRHNSAYWDSQTPYSGIGPGAHSWIDGVRSSVPARLSDYLDANGLLAPQIEEESEANRINDFILVSLRRAAGLYLDTAATLFGEPEHCRLQAAALPHLNSGMLQPTSAGFRIPEQHWIRSNSVLLDLFHDLI